ncbi:MAG TPA: FadR/GntR family transcriptional regulator, partial [Solirubrobacterales bacterium]|jgi:GntR family transcriptional repressor for pyruvate dehydrogenase complex
MPERELAEQLGVSRTSVRQALTALRVVGMVDVRPGDGVYLLSTEDIVPSLALEVLESESEYPMIWEVREAVETQAARLAAKRRTQDDLDTMKAALEAMAESVSGGGEGILGDRHFHQAILGAAHNPMLQRLFEQLADAIDKTSQSSLGLKGQPPISLEAHTGIYEAIAAGEEELAGERMRNHMATSASTVLAARRAESTGPG